MTSSERFSAYLAGKPVDRAPMIEWAPYWEPTLERWHREGLPDGSNDELHHYFGLDRVWQNLFVCRTAQTPAPSAYGIGIMEDESDYERIRPTLFPEPADIMPDTLFERLHSSREQRDYLNFLTVEGFFWYPRVMFGIENHLYSFYDYPDLYKRICEDYTDWLIRVFQYAFSRFRFDFMSFAEDMSYNNGPMISKTLFDEFLAPFYRRVIPVIHSYGIPVFVDSDGDITLAVDWYAEVGADGMFPLERQAGVDVSAYLDKQPQMAFLGHFDKTCMKYGEDAMRAEFERILPSMLRGKVISSVDHQTPPDVSLENYRVYLRLFREYTAKVTHAQGGILPCPVFAESNEH